MQLASTGPAASIYLETHNQASTSNSSIARIQVPERSSQEREDDCETPFNDKKADFGSECADGEHEG